MESIEIMQSWAPLIGFALPYLQEWCNQIVKKDLKILFFSLTITQQKVLMSYFLCILIALVASIKSQGFDFNNMVISASEMFALSQATYHTYFKPRKQRK